MAGLDRRELAEWIAIARERLMGPMDITPEILTHAAAFDLETGALLSENERDWSTHQTAATLTPYIAHALQILKDAGLEATGITSPWNFGQAVETSISAPSARQCDRSAAAGSHGISCTWIPARRGFCRV